MKKYATAGIKAIIQNNEGKFLAIQERINGIPKWTLPGGRIEIGEIPVETLVREVREEVGLVVTIEMIIGLWWNMSSDSTTPGQQNIYTTYLCSYQGGEIHHTDQMSDEDILDYRWVTKEEFLPPDYVPAHESLKDVVRMLP
ncbi:MAG: NUDIX hydrolase [Parcubacteria group bacterium GW2011_GWA2_47_8]|nr:MAG: NUDIX hydrolase [Parcubacteria group bacterium GW2011_GWA2_47_8]